MHPVAVSILSCLLVTGAFVRLCAGYVAQTILNDHQCTKTTVAILGGGMAGITAAQALTNASITDFIILEYRDTLGGRVWHSDFGKDEEGDPYLVEFGANWIQGLGSDTAENPIWRLAQKYNLRNTYSNYSSIRTYNETGYTDYSNLLDTYAAARKRASEHAGQILNQNLQDMTARSGLALAGWRPRKDNMAAQAVEWWNWGMNRNAVEEEEGPLHWEVAYTPETSSLVFGVAGENLTFNQFGGQNNLVLDPRGYSAIIQGEAESFRPHASRDDARIRLRTEVTTIEYSDDGVLVHNRDGSCVSAAYAICTFSLGVLQNDVVQFHPELPEWKQTAIEKFNMGTYTKIFMQFEQAFWPPDTQFFLYASPTTRGYYPVFQSLSTAGFLPGSNIIFVTVVDSQAYRVERQPDAQTKREVLEVLRQMFPDKKIPEPVAFAYPRWSTEPWAFGSYSNWPAGTTLKMHQNLRANVHRLWFAGEATSAQYFGFLHGAWYEGRDVGQHVAALLRDECLLGLQGATTLACGEQQQQHAHYDVLHGTTPIDAYTPLNGWSVNSTNW
ncbi:hypothetical protein AOCH_006762 [Aspergillus ochraceoroseus]|uniref:Amine oxidase domain-containing protein n=1 Tax=Aspergillus ochraceoroseus TaxID=138278 RepID=A0A0F8WSY4_9EURO|nr:hypothetical protein AOCH_006762 [Aspergillus ochraceoroseus]